MQLVELDAHINVYKPIPEGSSRHKNQWPVLFLYTGMELLQAR